MKMPGQPSSPDTWEEEWTPLDKPPAKPGEEEAFKPKVVEGPRDDRAAPPEVNPFQRFLSEPAPKAERVERGRGLGDRFYQHWLNSMYGGTAGIAEAAILADESADPAYLEQLKAERAWRELQFADMPDAETPLEYATSITGGLLGGITDPLSQVPIARVTTASFRASRPVVSAMLNQGVSGAAMNAAANTALQTLEMGADLRDEFDLTDLAFQTGIGAVAGAGFGAVEGVIAKQAAKTQKLTQGLAGAPEPGKATRVRRGPAIGVQLKGETGEPVMTPIDTRIQDFEDFLTEKGVTPEQFAEIDKDPEASKALYNEYLAQASETAQGAAGTPATPSDLLGQYGPERLNAAQEALFGEVVGTRNLSPEQNTQLQDYLSGTEPATQRADGKKTIGVNSKGQTVVEYNGGRRGVYDKDGNLTIETPNLVLQEGGAERADGGFVRKPEYEVVTESTEPPLPPSEVPIGPYQQFRPDELKVDAKRFQFKEGGDEAGVTERLKGVKKWDPTKAGQTLVWESKEGEFFIADGHQRHGLGTRMAAEGQDVRIPAYVLREADGISADDARVIAAAKNIAEGTGSAIDAAKILRTRPDMEVNLPPTSALVRDAAGLAKLSDDAFGMVVNKKVPAQYAAIVGKLAPDQGTHAELLQMLAKNEPENVIEAESMVRDALDAPTVQSTMEDMFGSSEVTQILFKERAQILSAAAKTIRKDRAAFSTLVKEEDRISSAGNKLATSANQERAAQDAALLATIQAAARRKGPVADALAAGAKRLKDGESRSAVVRDFIEALRQEARAAIPGGGGAGGAGQGQQIAASGVRRNTDTAAFAKWFGDSKVVDEAGEPLVVVHATDAETDFDAFKTKGHDIGVHFGTSGQANDRIGYKAEMSKMRGGEPRPPRSIPVYLSIKKPLRMGDLGNWSADNMGFALNRMPEFARDKDGINRMMSMPNAKGTAEMRKFLQSKGYDGVVYKNEGETAGADVYRQREAEARDRFAEARDKPNKVFMDVTAEDRLSPEYQTWKQAEAAYEKFRNENAEDSWIAFDPTQIKSVFNRGTFDPKDARIAFSPQRQGGPSLFDVGADNRPQSVLPGAERITDKALAERKGAGGLKSSKAQKGMDFGLFGDSKDQLDLVDLSRVAPYLRVDADYVDLRPSSSSKSIRLGDSDIQYGVKDGEVELISVRTPPQLRGQGRAREALMAFLEQVDDAGMKVRAFSTPLDRTTNQDGVIRFYQSLGFTPTGRKINKDGDIEMLREGPPPEVADLRNLVGSGQLIPLQDYTDPSTAAAVTKAYIGNQPARAFDDIYGGRAEMWQAQLGVAGDDIARQVGARFGNPGIKKRAEAEAKIGRKNYRSTSQITDIVRAGFMVDHPDQVQRIINMLAQRFRVLDEGWKINDVNYFDRKALVQFPDGTIGEIQFWEPSLIAAKNGEGHKLYEKARALPPGDPGRVAAEQAQRDLYGEIVSSLDPAWAATVGRSSGKSGNVFENNIRMASSEGSGVPESTTSAESAGSQGSPFSATTQAKPSSTTAGRPSQSKNRMGEGIAAKTRPPQQPVPTNRAQSGTVAGGAGGAERLEDIAADLKELVGFKVPVRQGRLARFRNASGQPVKAAGQYDRDQGVIRMAEMSDFETQTHETAHALETEYGRTLAGLKATHAGEIDQMAYPGATDVNSEGFAEFVRFYVSNPAYAQRNAPGFYAAFEAMLDPEQLGRLQDIQDRYVAWQQAPSQSVVTADVVSARKRGLISDSVTEMRRNGVGITLGQYFDKLYTRTIDKAHPIAKMVDELKKVHEAKTGQALDLIAAQDPYKLARLFPDAQSRGHMDLMHGVLRYGSTQRDGPGLADALEVAFGSQWQNWNDEQLAEFAAYLVSRRSIKEYERFFQGEIPNTPGKFTLGDYQVAKDEFEAAHPEWIQAADMVYEWGKNMLAKKADAGFISQKMFQELIQREDYAPLMRDLTDLDKEVLSDMSVSRTLKSSLLKRFRGSKRSVINPIEAMAKDAYDVNVRIAANDIAKAIDDLARTVGVGAGAFVERIPDKELKLAGNIDIEDALRQAAKDAGLNPTDVDQLTTSVGNLLGDDAQASIFRWTDTNEKGEPIIYVWRDGKRSALRLADGDFGKEVYQALTGLNKEMQGMFTAIASLPSTAIRYGITTAPHFVIANYIRDQVSAWVLTEGFGFGTGGFTPGISGALGLRDEITQAEITRAYNSFGGIMGGGNVAALDRARASRDVRALQKRGYAIKRFASVRGFAELTELTETGTRLALFKNAYERSRREGLNDYEAAVEAAYVSRDYIDFGRHGSKMLAARRLVPFLNASLQGLDKTLRTTITPWVKLRTGRPLSAQDKKALKVSAQAWVKMTAVGLAGLGLSYIYRDDPEYEEISDYLKATHWMVKYGDGKWVAVPKPFELGFVSNLFERSFEAIYKQDPTAMSRFMDGLYEVTAPPFVGALLKGDVKGALRDIPVIGEAAAIATNTDFMTGRPIVPEHMLGLEPSERYTAYTSELAQKLGKAVNISPAVIDHAISGYGGSWGTLIQRFSTDVANDEGPVDTVANMVTRRFIREAARGGTSSRAFWNMIGETTGTMERVSKTYSHMLKNAGVSEASKYVDSMGEDERAYALLNGHFEAEAKRLHPLRRAQDAISAVSQVRKEIAGDKLTRIEDKKVPIEEREQLVLTPSQRQTAQDILSKIEMVEARNALIAIKAPGWAHRQPMDLDSLHADLALALPQVEEEVLARFEEAKVYDAESVKESWPDVRERILTERQDADFSDIIAGAK